MKSCINEILKFYGRKVKEAINPVILSLFEVNKDAVKLHTKDRALFHAAVAILYLGKRGRPDILLAVKFLCTQVRGSTEEERRKLERVLGYLTLMKSKTM
jgi:hypothetical protein